MATNRNFYSLWHQMKSRCIKKNHPAYYRYGGRGIDISESWMNFKNFEKDMYLGYMKGLSVDRIDNNKGYSKENCRWATPEQQNNNSRRNNLFEFKGISDTLTHWAKFFSIKYSTLSMRVYVYKWNMEKSLYTPVNKYERRIL